MFCPIARPRDFISWKMEHVNTFLQKFSENFVLCIALCKLPSLALWKFFVPPAVCRNGSHLRFNIHFLRVQGHSANSGDRPLVAGQKRITFRKNARGGIWLQVKLLPDRTHTRSHNGIDRRIATDDTQHGRTRDTRLYSDFDNAETISHPGAIQQRFQKRVEGIRCHRKNRPLDDQKFAILGKKRAESRLLPRKGRHNRRKPEAESKSQARRDCSHLVRSNFACDWLSNQRFQDQKFLSRHSQTSLNYYVNKQPVIIKKIIKLHVQESNLA